jgi:hypothetical protein
MTLEIAGVLEIDYDRGVIYFHDVGTGQTVLRICSLPKPIPEGKPLDITYGFGVSWDANTTPHYRSVNSTGGDSISHSGD